MSTHHCDELPLTNFIESFVVLKHLFSEQGRIERLGALCGIKDISIDKKWCTVEKMSDLCTVNTLKRIRITQTKLKFLFVYEIQVKNMGRVFKFHLSLSHAFIFGKWHGHFCLHLVTIQGYTVWDFILRPYLTLGHEKATATANRIPPTPTIRSIFCKVQQMDK